MFFADNKMEQNNGNDGRSKKFIEETAESESALLNDGHKDSSANPQTAQTAHGSELVTNQSAKQNESFNIEQVEHPSTIQGNGNASNEGVSDGGTSNEGVSDGGASNEGFSDDKNKDSVEQNEQNNAGQEETTFNGMLYETFYVQAICYGDVP